MGVTKCGQAADIDMDRGDSVVCHTPVIRASVPRSVETVRRRGKSMDGRSPKKKRPSARTWPAMHWDRGLSGNRPMMSGFAEMRLADRGGARKRSGHRPLKSCHELGLFLFETTQGLQAASVGTYGTLSLRFHGFFFSLNTSNSQLISFRTKTQLLQLHRATGRSCCSDVSERKSHERGLRGDPLPSTLLDPHRSPIDNCGQMSGCHRAPILVPSADRSSCVEPEAGKSVCGTH